MIVAMIARIAGYLDAVEGGMALVRMPVGDGAVAGESGCAFTYEVLLPAFAAARLSRNIGQRIMLHTLYYLEGQNQGASMLPRLVGFLTIEDRQFYELFTTCKGIGHRKALRAMTLSTDVIAAAIADRDLDLLQSLPEIGRRTAETIVATLRGKVDRFVATATYPTPQRNGAAAGSEAEVDAALASGPAGQSNVAREALKVLLQLGETRADAVRWIDQALVAAEDGGQDRPKSAEELIARVYQIKSM